MATVVASALIIIAASLEFACGACNVKHAARRNEVMYITSPGYPGNFTQYVDCYYEVYSTSDNLGLVVHVDVVDVSLNCEDNNTQLNVYDGFSRSPRFLGQICKGGQMTFESPKHTLYLTFRSRTEHASRSRGFRLRVWTEPKYCHCYTHKIAVLDVTSSAGILTTPFYPYGTEANVWCRWLLKAAEDSRVNVTLLDADMKGSSHCRNFALRVYDGKTTYDDKLLASVCGNSVQTFHSSGRYLLVEFSSGPLVYRSGGGVKLQYWAVPSEVREKQLIGQTLFYVITAMLILLIIVISVLAAIKLFLLPRRRKSSERRRRAARARLTRVSQSSSNSQSSRSTTTSRSESLRHASCSRAVSSVSVGSASSQPMSGMSLTRLLSLYGLKKCRQENRSSNSLSSSPSATGSNSACPYNAQRSSSGVLIRVPDYPYYEAGHLNWFAGELPPSYEEAIRQGPLGEVLEQAMLQEAIRESSAQEEHGMESLRLQPQGAAESLNTDTGRTAIGQTLLGDGVDLNTNSDTPETGQTWLADGMDLDTDTVVTRQALLADGVHTNTDTMVTIQTLQGDGIGSDTDTDRMLTEQTLIGEATMQAAREKAVANCTPDHRPSAPNRDQCTQERGLWSPENRPRCDDSEGLQVGQAIVQMIELTGGSEEQGDLERLRREGKHEQTETLEPVTTVTSASSPMPISDAAAEEVTLTSPSAACSSAHVCESVSRRGESTEVDRASCNVTVLDSVHCGDYVTTNSDSLSVKNGTT